MCALLAARLLRGLARSRAPEPSSLLSELLAEVGAQSVDSEFARRAAIAELNRRLSDVSFDLQSLPARFTALTRICLASGTALALFGYIGANGNDAGAVGASVPSALSRVFQLALCAGAGVLGAACTFSIGRMAKQQSAAIREDWDRASREVGRALGTSLEAPAHGGRDGRDREHHG